MTEAEALKEAEKVAATHGWTWVEPITVTRKKRWFRESIWIVQSNAHHRGCNVRVELNAATGQVLAACFLPR